MQSRNTKEPALNKTLIIIRHAHRDTSKGQEVNNGLSDKGRRQVRKLFDFFFERYPDYEKPVLITSPKKRCVETLEPLARKLERKIHLEKDLEERSSEETSAEFKRRVRRFAKHWLQQKEKLTVISSHGDWIPVFLKELIGVSVHLQKGGWIEIVMNEKPQLTWLIQNL